MSKTKTKKTDRKTTEKSAKACRRPEPVFPVVTQVVKPVAATRVATTRYPVWYPYDCM